MSPPPHWQAAIPRASYQAFETGEFFLGEGGTMLRIIILGLSLAILGAAEAKQGDNGGPARGHQSHSKAAAKARPKTTGHDRHKGQKPHQQPDRDLNTRPIGAGRDHDGPRAKIPDRQDN